MLKCFLSLIFLFVLGAFSSLSAADSQREVSLFVSDSGDQKARLCIMPQRFDSVKDVVNVVDMSLFVNGKWFFSNVEVVHQKDLKEWKKLKTWILEKEELKSLFMAFESNGLIPMDSTNSLVEAEDSTCFIKRVKNIPKLRSGIDSDGSDDWFLPYIPSPKVFHRFVVSAVFSSALYLLVPDFKSFLYKNLIKKE